MARKKSKSKTQVRRTFTKQFKQDADQMLLDGHSASSVSANLGLDNTNLLYRWKAELLDQIGPVGEALDDEIKQLRDELLRTRKIAS